MNYEPTDKCMQCAARRLTQGCEIETYDSELMTVKLLKHNSSRTSNNHLEKRCYSMLCKIKPQAHEFSL